ISHSWRADLRLRQPAARSPATPGGIRPARSVAATPALAVVPRPAPTPAGPARTRAGQAGPATHRTGPAARIFDASPLPAAPRVAGPGAGPRGGGVGAGGGGDAPLGAGPPRVAAGPAARGRLYRLGLLISARLHIEFLPAAGVPPGRGRRLPGRRRRRGRA